MNEARRQVPTAAVIPADPGNLTDFDERDVFAACLEARRDQWSRLIFNAGRGDSKRIQRLRRLMAAHDRATVLDGARAPQADPQSIGPYEILRRLGEGGMGVVFAARRRRSGQEPAQRQVAIKTVRATAMTSQIAWRFRAERRALLRMAHPNIVGFLGAGSHAGVPYIVMELVDGAPLLDYCDERSISLPERARLLAPVCRAVSHAHARGIIHRDLKPANIIVTESDGRAVPKIIDFGISRPTTRSSGARAPRTLFGQLVGTPEYMSPEQASTDGGPVSRRSDVYSLGVVLYQLLCGELPFASQEGSTYELLRRVRTEIPIAPSMRSKGDAVSPRLDGIVMKALEKDPRKRYASPAEMADAIEGVVA